MNVDPDHVPAPAGHAPRLAQSSPDGVGGLLVVEDRDGAFIYSSATVEVCR